MSHLGFRSSYFARAILLVALLCSASAAYAGRFLYTGGHSLDDARVAAIGHTYFEFTGDDAGWAAALAGEYGAFDAILVGENSGSNALSASTSSAIAAYVSNGGRVIVASDHNGNVGFLNAVFGYSATVRYGCYDDDSVAASLQSGAAGTTFAAGPGTVGNLSCTSAFDSASVPASARKLYTGTDADAPTTLAFAGGYGNGRLVWLGWDYCCGGSEAQNDDWYMVLDSSIKFVGATCAGLSGGQLFLCRQICEVRQTPTSLALMTKAYTTFFRSAPPCGGFVAPLRAPVAYDGNGGGGG